MNNNGYGASTLTLRSPSRSASKKPPTQVELEKARAETARVRAEAAAALEKVEQLRAGMVKAGRDNKLRLRTTAVIMMTAALLKLGWEAAHAEAPVPAAGIAQPLTPAAAAIPVASIDRGKAGSIDSSEGAVAMERLRDAFHSFPDQDQTILVREINTKYAGTEMTCPLVWNDGVPALYVGDRKGGAPPPLMAAALNRCANAVEKLRADKDAALALR